LASKELNLLLYGDHRPFLQGSFLNFRSISALRGLSESSSAYARERQKGLTLTFAKQALREKRFGISDSEELLRKEQRQIYSKFIADSSPEGRLLGHASHKR
jgi:hypothetical protein